MAMPSARSRTPARRRPSSPLRSRSTGRATLSGSSVTLGRVCRPSGMGCGAIGRRAYDPRPPGEGVTAAEIPFPPGLAWRMWTIRSSAYDPVREDVEVGRSSCHILRPSSAEDLIDEDEYARDERLPYWAELWPSGIVLAERLCARPLGRRPGGGARLRRRRARDRRRARRGRRRSRPTGTPRPWRSPAPTRRRRGAGWRRWRWTGAGRLAALFARGPADLVIGADLLYEERNGAALAALLPRLLRPAGEALIADPRRPHAAALLEPLRAAGWGHARRGRPLRAAAPTSRAPSSICTGSWPREPDAISGLAAGWATLVRERSSVAQW